MQNKQIKENKMVVKLKLKNADQKALISQKAHDSISKSKYLNDIKFLDNLRLHSHGYVFFQKSYPLKDGSYQTITIYLHKLIAKDFLNTKAGKKDKLFIHFKNGKRHDCQEANLECLNMQQMVRTQNKSKNATGFRGVVKDGKKYKAMLYDKKQRHYLGRFDTAEEAAVAYDKKSNELFGKSPFLNNISKKALETAKAVFASKKVKTKTKVVSLKPKKVVVAKKPVLKKVTSKKISVKPTTKKVSKPKAKSTIKKRK